MNDGNTLNTVIKKLLSIYFNNEVENFFSYVQDFETLWEFPSEYLDYKVILVFDEPGSTFNWLSIDIWSHFVKAKYGNKAPNIMLLKHSNSSSTPYSNLNLKIFPKCEGIKTFYIDSPNFVKELILTYSQLDCNKIGYESDEDVMVLKQLLYAIFTSPQKRHSVSNKISPLILFDSLSKQRDIFIERNKDNNFSNHFMNCVKEFIDNFDIKPEELALLEFWKWLSNSDEQLKNSHKLNYADLFIKDIFNVWSNSRFLLIDDDADNQQYNKILTCALKIMAGSNVSLEYLTYIPSTVIEIEKYDAIFLDLRFSEEDITKKVESISGVKFAKMFSEKYPAMPIVIFSSSHQMEINNYLSKFPNIVLDFRKPGVAGIDNSGETALINLLSAIKKSLEFLENNIVFNKINYINNNSLISAKKGLFSQERFKEFYKEFNNKFIEIFFNNHFLLAMSYPYSFFESVKSLDSESEELIYKSKDNINKEIIRASNRKQILFQKELNGIDLKVIETPVKFEQIKIEIAKPRDLLRLNILALKQIRNIFAHGRRFPPDEMRRKAILVFNLFIDCWLIYNEDDNIELKKFDNEIIQKLSKIHISTHKIFKDDYLNFPLTRKYPSDHKVISRYINDIFYCTCYYGNSIKYYGNIYSYLNNSN